MFQQKLHINPLEAPNHDDELVLLEPKKTTLDISNIDILQQKSIRTNWYPKYLIDPTKHSHLNISICKNSTSQSIVVMVLSSYQNIDLRYL